MEITNEVWKRHFPAEKSGVHLFPEFEMRARAVSGEVFRVPTAAEAREALLRLVDAVQAKKAVVVESPLQEAAGITEALRSRGVAVYTEAADIAAHADTADIGISGVEFGIAETGSVFQDGLPSRPAWSRSCRRFTSSSFTAPISSPESSRPSISSPDPSIAATSASSPVPAAPPTSNGC